MLPSSGISRLSKTLISITGPDATKFLNGLITSRMLPTIIKKKQHTISEAENRHAELAKIINIKENWGLMHEDIYDPEQKIFIGRDGIYTMMLNSRGRVVNDAFLYSNPFHNIQMKMNERFNNSRYLLEVDSSILSQFMMILKLHKLSAEVSIKVSDLISYYYYSDTEIFDEYLDFILANYFQALDPVDALNKANSFMRSKLLFNENIADHIVSFAVDNRIPNFGLKFVTDKPIEDNGDFTTSSIFSEEFMKEFLEPRLIDEHSIIQRRYLNGLYEISDAPKGISMLPFEANVDYTNGISLDKGCYVGQELTIRTYNSGVIRKRVVPVQFFEFDEQKAEEMHHQEHLTLNPDDHVVDILLIISESNLSKLELQPLNKNNEDSSKKALSNSPFGNSQAVRRRKLSSGKIISVIDNLGFVSMNMDELKKQRIFKTEVPCVHDKTTSIGIKFFLPEWWPQDE